MKDTNDFIKKIENVNNKTDHSYLVSLDVRSLYTNIPHTEGIEVVRKSLQKSKPSISISIFITSLGLILLNNVIFNGVKYLQKKGCALGKCTHSYENLLMSWFEEHFIYAVILQFSKFYLRYTDDIFLICNGTKEQFESFLHKKANNCHPTIKYEYQISKTEIRRHKAFFDMTVFKVGNQLHTKLYMTPTDKHLHSKSPMYCKERLNWFHSVTLLQFLLSLVSTLFIWSFFKFLLWHGWILLKINSGHKWSTTHRVLKSHISKMSVIYM